jgi:hypothetical protein
MIAAFRHVGNVGFLIYVADAFGYLGSVGVLLFKETNNKSLTWLQYFTQISYALAIVGTLGTAASMIYFGTKYSRLRRVSDTST